MCGVGKQIVLLMNYAGWEKDKNVKMLFPRKKGIINVSFILFVSIERKPGVQKVVKNSEIWKIQIYRNGKRSALLLLKIAHHNPTREIDNIWVLTASFCAFLDFLSSFPPQFLSLILTCFDGKRNTEKKKTGNNRGRKFLKKKCVTRFWLTKKNLPPIRIFFLWILC